VFAPMPKARVRKAIKVKAGFFNNIRMPNRMSCRSVSMSLFPISDFRFPIANWQ
jgi:hypothetical protein